MTESRSPAQLTEVLRAELCARWERGQPTPAEELLRRHPSALADPACALQLVYQEVLLRERHGETPLLGEYERRFPQFADRLRPLFAVHEALESERPLAPSCVETARDLNTATAERGLPAVPGYEVLEVLGRGGMGVVYKAKQVGLNRLVALKMIRAGVHADADDRARFRGEAEAQARLRHPNIVPVYEVGEWRGCPYLAMEYVGGGSLVQHLTGRPLAPPAAAALVETLARAMHHAHERGLVHRDLKPGNILLQGEGTADTRGCTQIKDKEENEEARSALSASSVSSICVHPRSSAVPWIPKIADFGLAKLLEKESGNTRAGDVIGTPEYMAPEQAEGRPEDVGPAADIYALGAILYELLTGRQPFQGATPVDTLVQVRTREPVPPRRRAAGVPRDLEAVCLRCLHKEPRRRYPDAAALAADLRRFRRGEPVWARRVTRLERLWLWCRRQPLVALLAAALVVVAASGLVSLFIGLLLVFCAGNLAILSLWLRAERRCEQAEDGYVRAEAEVARARHEQERAESELLEAFQQQSRAVLRAQRAGERRQCEADAAVRRQAARLQEELARCCHELGNAHARAGEHVEAVACYERTLALRERQAANAGDARRHSDRAGTWNNLGEVLRQLGRLEEARHACANAVEEQRRAVGADPSLLGLYYGNLARVSRERGACEAAAGACLEGACACPGDPERLFLLACELAQCAGATADEAGRDEAAAARGERWAAEAVLLLQRVLTEEAADAAQFLREPALEPLWQRSDFRELLTAGEAS